MDLIPLTYGSTIYLSPQGDPDAFVYSDGFVKTTLSLRHDDRGRANGGIFDRCLFKIYPSFSNTVKKEALAPDLFKNNYSESKKLEMAEDLKDRLSSEFKFNLESCEKVQGTPISFDQPVQFLHVASNKFLCLHNQEADIERENFKLELVQYPSEWTVFKFSPSFKHQKESEGVIYPGDFTFITSAQMIMKKAPHLHATVIIDEEENFQSARTVFEDVYNESPEFQKNVRIVTRGHKEKSPKKSALKSPEKTLQNKREVNASIESSVRWEIHLFADPDLEEDYLAFGDVIWINNAESNFTLVTQRDLNDVPVVEFTKAIPTDNFQHYVGHSTGMWVIENKNPYVGGNVRWGDSFRLRSLTLGVYLSVKKDVRGKFFLGVDGFDGHNSYWRFSAPSAASIGKDASKSKTFIPKDTFLLLQTDVDSSIGTQKREVGLMPSVVHYLRAANTRPVLEREWEEQDICKVNRANMNEIWETSFLVSCFPRLKKYVDFTNMYRQVKINLNRERTDSFSSKNRTRRISIKALYPRNDLSGRLRTLRKLWLILRILH